MPPTRIAVRAVAVCAVAVWTVAWMAFSWSALLSGQTSPPASAPTGLEFPVTFRRSLVAGKTPVGSKVEARLELATLAKGIVIPQGATLSGEVIESASKTATDPSRIAVRMDWVRWKTGSASIKAYLTASYCPIHTPVEQGSMDPDQDNIIHRTRRGSKALSPNLPDSSDLSTSSLSNKRIAIRDVEWTRRSDGALALTSQRVNIKLDGSTAYVLVTEDVTPAR